MRTALVAINAKYIHTNPAVRSIALFCAAQGLKAPLTPEFTINQRADAILPELYALEADLYLFSGYIWNIGLIRELASDLKKLLPRSLLGVGGPETTYRAESFLWDNPCFDLVVCGEGEASVAGLLRQLGEGGEPCGLSGVTARRADGSIVAGPPPTPMDLDQLPFPYPDLAGLKGRIPYYESARGCPFSCAYCLSSVERGVRFRSLELVFRDMRRFLDAGVPQVKLVDRTFNCDPSRARSIWRFLMEQDNGAINFHFELAGELLDGESLDLLEQARPGLFQFEIGVQSCNPKTLEAISRSCDLDKLEATTRRLSRAGNIHLHLDLIAGLPHEDLDSFTASFHRVYGLEPDQLQLGFLKVLGGSRMEARSGEWGIQYRDRPPYQVLSTSWLSYRELELLEGVAEMVETYYNSGRFTALIRWLLERFPSPFALYRSLWECYRGRNAHLEPLSKVGYYELPARMMEELGHPLPEEAQWLCKYDMLRHEKIRRLPDWVDVDAGPGRREEILALLSSRPVAEFLREYGESNPKRLARLAHVEIFPFHPETGAPGEVAALFHYLRRDFRGRAAVTFFPCMEG